MVREVEVTIKPSRANQYASIKRACITAAQACKRLGDEPEAMAKAKQLLELEAWASTRFNETILG